MVTVLDAEDGYRALTEASAWVRLPDFAVLLFTGADAKSWLQGQITNDVRLLSVKDPLETCVCSATGQLEAIASLAETSAGVTAVTDAPEVLERRVENFVVMEDVQVQRVSGVVWTYQGPLARSKSHGGTDRSGFGGYDVVLKQGEEPAGPIVSRDLLDLVALEAGVPLFGVDTDPKTLPPELGEAFLSRTVSFNKGCYLGQEILMRIRARGHTNRRWVGLKSDALLATGEVVTRSALSPTFGYIAAAMVRKENAEPGTELMIEGVEAKVVEFPFRRPSQ